MSRHVDEAYFDIASDAFLRDPAPGCNSRDYSSVLKGTHVSRLHVTAYFALEQLAAQLHEQHGSSPKDRRGQTPLHCGGKNGYQEVVKLLLDRDANLNI
jgi:ankyrin repeat protein